MKPHVRRAVAYIVGRLATGSESGSIYDFAASRFTMYSGQVGRSSLSVYDFDEKAFITGGARGQSGNLYHHGDHHFINLTVKGGTFNGYDFGTSSHFQGTVSGSAVTLYDFADGQFYHYSV